MKNYSRMRVASAVAGICLAAGGACAQISSVNSVVIVPRVSNDYPGATGTYVNDYPESVTLGESGEYGSSGFANRDEWLFSNNGSTPYSLEATDYFTVSMTLTMTGSTNVDDEAGFIIPNANGEFPDGDLQFKADVDGGFLGSTGGNGSWDSHLTYTPGAVVTLGMQYLYDAANNVNALQFWINAGGGNLYSPFEDLQSGETLAGDTLGAYYQLQGTAALPGSSGQAVFSTISVPEPSTLALLCFGVLPLARLRSRRA